MSTTEIAPPTAPPILENVANPTRPSTLSNCDITTVLKTASATPTFPITLKIASTSSPLILLISSRNIFRFLYCFTINSYIFLKCVFSIVA
jgi:hypothetical protein